MALAITTGTVQAQQFVDKKQTDVHVMSKTYTWPQDQAVLQKLDQWQDLKFGFFVHWGPYSQKGYCESWTICTEDVDWIQRDTTISYDEYYRNYVNLKKTFNPVKFNPGYWADLAKEAMVLGTDQ